MFLLLVLEKKTREWRRIGEPACPIAMRRNRWIKMRICRMIYDKTSASAYFYDAVVIPGGDDIWHAKCHSVNG